MPSQQQQQQQQDVDAIDFNFPGEPYEVQVKLMRALYTAIEHRHIGLFESPTGTGKTLSIICATLTWLNKNRVRPSSLTTTTTTTTTLTQDEEDPSWVTEHLEERHTDLAKDAMRRRAKAYCSRVRAIGVPTAAKRINNHNKYDDLLDIFSDSSDEDDNNNGKRKNKNVLEEEEEEETKRRITRKRTRKNGINHNAMSVDGVDVEDILCRDEDNAVRPTRIVFATRTHTQMSQFVNELRRTSFLDNKKPTMTATTTTTTTTMSHGDNNYTVEKNNNDDVPLTVLSFGSRRHLCINDSVQSLKHNHLISERCRDLTTASTSITSTSSSSSSSKKRQSCKFHDAVHEQNLRDTLLLSRASTIEDISRSARVHGACPYFATRSAIAHGDADVIVVPYAAVLHSSTRKSLGLTIDSDTVVVFDEAHNVMQCVRDIHSTLVTKRNLGHVVRALERYLNKFLKRLSIDNLFKVRQCLRVAKGLLSILEKKKGEIEIKSMEDVVFDSNVDNVNLVELVQFLEDSRLCQKLRGYIHLIDDNDLNNNKTKEKKQDEDDIGNGSGIDLDAFQRFVHCMCSANATCGRVAIYPASTSASSPSCSSAYLRYFVVDASSLFRSSVGNARSVLLLGGTLSPRAGLCDGLLRDLIRDRELSEFECEHVVPPENVLGLTCEYDVTGRTALEFTYRNRPMNALVNSLYEIITQGVGKNGGGVVIFLTSYDMLECVYKMMMTDEKNRMVKIFREQRQKVHHDEDEDEDDKKHNAWIEYQNEIHHRCGHATLLAVMGGKLSEGINFSDDLGRCVVIVGMPFANRLHPETAEMLKKHHGNVQQEIMENECMTIVNQCVGRAVRHRKDYASVVFLDRRYGRDVIKQKMAGFVKRNLKHFKNARQCTEAISSFLNSKHKAKG